MIRQDEQKRGSAWSAMTDQIWRHSVVFDPRANDEQTLRPILVTRLVFVLLDWLNRLPFFQLVLGVVNTSTVIVDVVAAILDDNCEV